MVCPHCGSQSHRIGHSACAKTAPSNELLNMNRNEQGPSSLCAATAEQQDTRQPNVLKPVAADAAAQLSPSANARPSLTHSANGNNIVKTRTSLFGKDGGAHREFQRYPRYASAHSACDERTTHARRCATVFSREIQTDVNDAYLSRGQAPILQRRLQRQHKVTPVKISRTTNDGTMTHRHHISPDGYTKQLLPVGTVVFLLVHNIGKCQHARQVPPAHGSTKENGA